MKLLLALHHPFELWRAPEWFASRLQSDFPALQIIQAANYEETAKLIADAEIMLGWSLRAEQFATAKKLRWIHSTAAAVHLLMSPELAASNVMVTNAREVHAPVVAEHAVAVMLALAKKIPSAVRYQEKKIWAQEQIYAEAPGEITGATLLLIGLGAIGRELARRASGLGMSVIALRQHPEREAPASVDEVFSAARLLEILPRADYVVLCAPLT